MRAHTLMIAVATAATLSTVAVASQAAARAPKTVKEVMTMMTIPASEAIFAGAAERPTNAEGWAAVRTAAVALAESGKLLMTGALAKDKGKWMEAAAALVKAADDTAKVAQAKDPDAFEEASDRVYTTCKACHDRYSGN